MSYIANIYWKGIALTKLTQFHLKNTCRGAIEDFLKGDTEAFECKLTEFFANEFDWFDISDNIMSETISRIRTNDGKIKEITLKTLPKNYLNFTYEQDNKQAKISICIAANENRDIEELCVIALLK